MKHFFNIFTLFALFAVMLANSSGAPNLPAPATPAPTTSTSRTWNLEDADILSVINEVSQETGKNFVVDPRVTGKISLISSKPIRSSEVYQLFLSVLETLGYSAIPSGRIIRIVPNIESSELATRIATSHSPGKGDEVVVRIVPLQNLSAAQLLPVLRPLLPQWSNLSVYTPGNVLILVGRADNLKRIVTIIEDIDSSSSSGIDLIRLHQASAGQVATVLTNLQNSSRANGTPLLSIAADERSNSILLSGNKSARLRMRILISQLDTNSSSPRGNTEVIYLRYLQAKNLAPLLERVTQNVSQPAEGSPTEIKTISRGAPENQTTIQAEPNTNAIVITAPPQMRANIKNIIAKLDIRPAQVLVEAIIVEIGEEDMKNLGIQWGGLVPADYNNPATTGASSAVSFPPIGAGTIGIIPHMQIQAVLSFLQNRVGVNILSTPSLVVLDNQKAILRVGKDVPEQTGSYSTTGSTATVSPFNTIARKLVALQLVVIPQINLGNAVRLRINLKNDSLQNPESPGLNPLINTSQIENSVIINSNDVLVLGGLISNNIIESTDKVPILGDVPGLGLLFTHKERKLERRNLIAFIKPTILYNSDDATAATQSKYNLVRHGQMDWPAPLSSKELKQRNVLPLWKSTVDSPKPFDT